ARPLDPLVRRISGGRPLATDPCPTDLAVPHVHHRPRRVLARSEGDRPSSRRVCRRPFHCALRELPPPDERHREGIDRPPRVPRRGAPVPRTRGCEEASARGRPPVVPPFPAFSHDVPDPGHDRGPRRAGSPPASRSGTFLLSGPAPRCC